MHGRSRERSVSTPPVRPCASHSFAFFWPPAGPCEVVALGELQKSSHSVKEALSEPLSLSIDRKSSVARFKVVVHAA